MATEENKANIRRVFEEGINGRNMGALDGVIGDDYVNHSFPAPAPGREGFKQVIGMFLSAFPDMHITLNDVLGEGDRVVTRGYFTGTHSGEFMGIPATGKQINVNYMDMWVIHDGKAAENWVQMDLLSLMQQLGVAPSPEQVSA